MQDAICLFIIIYVNFNSEADNSSIDSIGESEHSK